MSSSRRNSRRALVMAFVIVGTISVFASMLLNPRLTRYVESDSFRAEIEKETARGLHFPNSQFAPIRRTGLLSARSDRFLARNGRKAMTALDAQGITARFNPLGVFFRRWQIEDLKIDRGEIGIQVYEPVPEPAPVQPWYHIFLPDRVYLKRVWSDDVDVIWPIRGDKGGIFRTRLLITPHGRDFEYRATSGTLKNPLMPELAVRQIHLLITKKLFSLYTLDLNSGEGSIHGEGTTVISGEKHADFSFKWNDVPVREWVPRTWSGKFAGAATGDLRWAGNDYRLAAATMTGAVDVKGGRVSKLKFLDQIAIVTNQKGLAQLELDECKARFKWRKGDCELSDIALEQAGKFRIEGTVSFSERSLGGTLQIGLAPDYLAWLPYPEEVFSRRSSRYLWTTVHLSGTPESPQQDLSPRLVAALKDSPGALLSAAFRALAAWLHGN